MIDAPVQIEAPAPADSAPAATREVYTTLPFDKDHEEFSSEIHVTRDIQISADAINGHELRQYLTTSIRCNAFGFVAIKITKEGQSKSVSREHAICELDFSDNDSRSAVFDALDWCRQVIPALQSNAMQLDQKYQPLSDTSDTVTHAD